MVLLAGAAPADAQEILEGWRLVHSDAVYDYFLDLGGISPAPDAADSARVVLAWVSQSLTRGDGAARAAMIATRRAAGVDTGGYGAYAASTHLVRIRCRQSRYAIVETVDFDRTGAELARFEPPPAWRPPGAGDGAWRRVVTLACSRAGSGPGDPQDSRSTSAGSMAVARAAGAALAATATTASVAPTVA